MVSQKAIVLINDTDAKRPPTAVFLEAHGGYGGATGLSLGLQGVTGKSLRVTRPRGLRGGYGGATGLLGLRAPAEGLRGLGGLRRGYGVTGSRVTGVPTL